MRPFVDGLNVVDKIQPVRYKWNGLWGRPNDDAEVIGVIGQELEKAAPYAVKRMKDTLWPGGVETGIVYIEHQPLIYLLVNSFVELHQRMSRVGRDLDLHG